ncbi:exosortase F system-associated membrane protein [Winogradskyella ursingii]|uniref:exosortase F system-associated membrane protein n=1 Tax=Winogradskyella ursingii TaxID=2686079 RepID=UPI0015CAD7C1|nr:exosortase F system-associated protein [Winogradskyella ursingii]
MSKTVRYILIGLLFFVLVAIRGFQDELFYDPYLSFFENDYLYIDNPRREVAKLTIFTSLRFLMNTLASLGILYLFFRDRSIIKFSLIIYMISFVVLIIPFMYFVINPKQEDYYLFFNLRRFLIQPILLIILLPAFYYHKLKR